MSKIWRYSTAVGIVLLAFICGCSCSTRIADFYALKVYPLISTALSLLSSPFPFSVQDVVIPLLIIAAFTVVAMTIKRRWGLVRGTRYLLTLLLWTYIWFYLGWCANYGRSNIFERSQASAVAYNEDEFSAFLEDFREQTNAAYVSGASWNRESLEKEIKAAYAAMPSSYGLAKPRSWQHPKTMMFSRLYSLSGIQGYMGPLFSESHLNGNLLPMEYPFVYAHEYSHLLGVSSEAEANWWAFQVCISSSDRSVRYSAYLQILPHVMVNALRFLSEEEYSSWISGLRPEVLADLRSSSDYWQSLRSDAVDRLQSSVYDLFLKSNRISSGIRNYSEVVLLLVSLPRP